MRKIKILPFALLTATASFIAPVLTSCGGQQIKVESIVARATPFKANKGSLIYCKANFTPANATNKNLTWEIVEGGNYCTLNTETGALRIGTGVESGNTIKVKATSKDNPEATSETTITVDTTADTDDYETYIHDRSFSLLGSGTATTWEGTSRYMAWGTCWILSDATPDDTSDYKYYIATNWHVKLGHDDVKSSVTNRDFNMYFGDNKKSSGLTVLDDYTKFTSYTLESESNFYYSSKTDAIDFYVAKADFASATGTAKTKLNKLNARQAAKGAITEFAPTVLDTQQFLSDEMYTAGYPVKNSYYATWEKHSFNCNAVGLSYLKKGSKSHTIDDNGWYVDTSPQYSMSVDQGIGWMSGGASGSMLLGKFDGQYKVCGIYWGGWTNESKTVFYPSFSILNSSSKNFIINYV